MAKNSCATAMAQRSAPRLSLDYFPTPPWATRAFCEWLRGYDARVATSVVWEPACGEGHMARPLAEYFGQVVASDVHDYGFGGVRDFLWPGHDETVDWIVTNPPFQLGQQFIATARERAGSGVAMLVRTAFLESAERHAKLFNVDPPSDILQFVERLTMFKGRLVREGSGATAYCWLVWRRGAPPATHFHWIKPCRRRLERDSDYPAPALVGPAP